MKTITLRDGVTTMLVDDEDSAHAERFSWWPVNGYAARSTTRAGRASTVYFHREVLDAPPGLLVDHRNGDGRDNRRANLRLVSARENAQAKHRARSDSLIGIRGVSKKGRRFRAQVFSGSQRIYASYHDTVEAAAAVAAARQHLFGDFSGDA